MGSFTDDWFFFFFFRFVYLFWFCILSFSFDNSSYTPFTLVTRENYS